MSDYHVMHGKDDGNWYQMVCHIPVPNENNAVGFNLRTALTQFLGTLEETSIVPFIDPAEVVQLQNGELFELPVEFATNPNESVADARAKMDVKFTQLSITVVNRIRERLKYWGYNRDVP